MAFAAVIFDMDGVLVDSEPMHFATTNEVLARHAARLSPEEYATCLGLTEIAFFERMVLRFGLRSTPADLAAERVAASLEALATGPLLPMDGALECLLRLSADGYPLALASSATAAQVGLVVERLGLRRVLEAVVSADDVSRGKPAPDLFLEAARRLGVPPAECLVVEDAVLGVQAARSAAMASVALVPPPGDGELHRQAGALESLSSLRELTSGALERLAARHAAGG